MPCPAVLLDLLTKRIYRGVPYSRPVLARRPVVVSLPFSMALVTPDASVSTHVTSLMAAFRLVGLVVLRWMQRATRAHGQIQKTEHPMLQSRFGVSSRAEVIYK